MLFKVNKQKRYFRTDSKTGPGAVYKTLNFFPGLLFPVKLDTSDHTNQDTKGSDINPTPEKVHKGKPVRFECHVFKQ
jgi:hypothetical protein